MHTQVLSQVMCHRAGFHAISLTGGPVGDRTTRTISIVVGEPEPLYRWSTALVGTGALQTHHTRLAAVVKSKLELRIWVRNFPTVSSDGAAPHTWGWHAPGFATAPGTDPAPTADEVDITRALRRGGLFPTLGLPDSRIIVPTQSLQWNADGAFFYTEVIIAQPGASRFTVTAGLGADSSIVADAFYTITTVPNFPAAPDPLFPKAPAAALPPFVRPTPDAQAAAVTPGLRGFRKDTALPAHVFIAGPTTDPDVPGGPLKPRTHFLASFAAPEDAVPAHFSRRFFDGTSPLDDPANPFEFTQVAVLGSVTLVADTSMRVWAHVPLAEAAVAARILEMDIRIPGFDFTQNLPGSPALDGVAPSFVLMANNATRLFPGSTGPARARMRNTPSAQEPLFYDRIRELDHLSFNIFSGGGDNRVYIQYTYYHIIATMAWVAGDPAARSGQLPPWATWEADGLISPPRAQHLSATTALDNIFFSWRPEQAPSFITLAGVLRGAYGADPALAVCNMLRIDMSHNPLNSTSFTTADDARIPVSQVFIRVPAEVCTDGIEVAPFGRGFPETLLVHPDGRLFRMALAGSVQAEPLRLLGGGDPVLQLPGGDTFDAVTQLEPGVVGLTTNTGRIFISMSTNTETAELNWAGVPSSWMASAAGWGTLGMGIVPPPGPGLTGDLKVFGLNLYASIVQQVLDGELAPCQLASLTFSGRTEHVLDKGETVTVSLVTESIMHRTISTTDPSLAEISRMPSTTVAYSMVQPPAAGFENSPVPGKFRHGYFEISIDRNVVLAENAEDTIASGGGGGLGGTASHGARGRIEANLRTTHNSPPQTVSLTLSSPMATVSCIAQASVVSSVIGEYVSEPVEVSDSASWSAQPLYSPPVPRTLSHITVQPKFSTSPFTFAHSLTVTGACPLGKRVSMAGISFDPADCPDFSAPDGARRFTTYDPRQHGPRDRVEPGLWRTFANGTVSTTQFEYPFERFGCPFSVYHSAFLGFAPKLNLIANGESNPLGSADFVVSELAGRSDFGYRMRGSDPGVCAHAPMTWAEARRRAEDRFGTGSIDMPKPWNVWQPSVHLGCNDKEVAGRPAPSGAPLELFGRAEYNDEFGRPNALAFPPNGVGGMFFMRARVVESGLSHCDLFTDFALDVYGAPVSLSTAMAALFGTIGVCTVLLAAGFGIFALHARKSEQMAIAAAEAEALAELEGRY